MRQQDVKLCCRMGVDICGFVTEYPIDVPWNLTRTQCAVLLNSVTANATAGGAADLDFYCRVRTIATCPVMLAGGINAENVQSIITEAAPDLIDVMTGIELTPGIKSEQKLVRLTAAFVD